MVLALGASPVAALLPTPATSFGGSSPLSAVNGGIPVSALDAAERLTAVGERHIEQHALADAEAAFRGALAIVEAALGATDPQLADSMTALGDVRCERRDFAGADILYRCALGVVETAYGAEDPRIAGPLGNLAGLYRKRERWDDAAAQGWYAEAEEFYGKVLAILAPWLGLDHALVQEVLAERAHARRQLELTPG
jgi:hypothetical protein